MYPQETVFHKQCVLIISSFKYSLLFIHNCHMVKTISSPLVLFNFVISERNLSYGDYILYIIFEFVDMAATNIQAWVLELLPAS